MDSKFHTEAKRLADEARKAVDTQYWVNDQWVNCSRSAAQNLYNQLAGIQHLFVRAGEGNSEACSAVNEQIRYIGNILDSNPVCLN